MNGGSPPTAPNARAGLFTPPGITRQARTNASWLRGRAYSGFDFAGVVASISGGFSSLGVGAPRPGSGVAEPARHVGRMVGQDHVGPGAFEAGRGLEDDPPLVDPAAGGGGLDHGVLARD